MDDLAERIARDVLGRPEATADARRAGVLAKANLATEMVGEFPELQGAMGGPWTLPSLWTRRRAHNTMDTPQTACPHRPHQGAHSTGGGTLNDR